jgi:flavin reductase (DIM6/NTAB) family NADH-FMN oxidoreductase RutF
MIQECPFNLEYKLVQTLELASDEVSIGEVAEVYAESRFLTNNLPDISKLAGAVCEGG